MASASAVRFAASVALEPDALRRAPRAWRCLAACRRGFLKPRMNALNQMPADVVLIQ
jgi:hypothetical protein